MAREKYDQDTIKFILNLLRLNYSERKIISELKKKQITISKGQIWKIKKKYFVVEKENEKEEKKKKKCGPKTRFTGRQIQNLKKMVNKANPPTQREMAKKLNCSQSMINHLIKNRLKKKKRIKPKVHRLTVDNIEKRRSRSFKLYQKLNNGKWKKFITTDEAWFYISNCNGKRRIQYVDMDDKNPKLEVFKRREQHSKGFMVWAGISFNGKTKLHFIEPGAKINSRYYIDHVLKPFLAKDAKRLFPDGDFVFHQDSAPSHVSKATINFMKDKMKFITKEEWLPKSPDVAPMDYYVWGHLKQLLWKKKVKDMAGLKRALNDAWKKLPQELINKALESWPKRVYKIYKAKGGYIENSE